MESWNIYHGIKLKFSIKSSIEIEEIFYPLYVVARKCLPQHELTAKLRMFVSTIHFETSQSTKLQGATPNTQIRVSG